MSSDTQPTMLPIPGAIASIQDNLTMLEERVDKSGAMIEPILSPEPPCDAPCTPREEGTCAIHESLIAIDHRICNLSDKLNRMSDRIQL